MKRLTLACLLLVVTLPAGAGERVRSRRFVAQTPEEARRWQQESCQQVFALLMGGKKPAVGPLAPHILQRLDVRASGYVLEEVTLQTLPDRRVHAWLAVPKKPGAKV